MHPYQEHLICTYDYMVRMGCVMNDIPSQMQLNFAEEGLAT